ncbi:MAG: transglutaminase-like cysteine peptidase [Alphaproteobacteria bacterium]
MSTYGKPAKTHRLRNAFLKATLAGVLLFPAYQAYVPDAWQEKISDTVSEATHISRAKADPANIKFVFDNDNASTVLGAQTKSSFYDNNSIQDQWFAMMGRHNLLLKNGDNAANYKQWLSQLDGLKGKSIAEKAKGVDALIDQQVRYVTDPQTYGKEDYWASPMETIAKKQGDCDDFAVLKYYALRYLGVEPERMHIVAVGTTGEKLDHATLMVNTAESGLLTSAWQGVSHKVFGTETPTNFVILDNDSSPDGKLVESRDSRYQPYYAMNEKEFRSVPSKSKLRW